ncbi:hypothetical protein E05_45900 [Plautia stali symbiont]|nr:hypothetical protein E05_45900 [Plautia stali symbiont]
MQGLVAHQFAIRINHAPQNGGLQRRQCHAVRGRLHRKEDLLVNVKTETFCK